MIGPGRDSLKITAASYGFLVAVGGTGVLVEDGAIFVDAVLDGTVVGTWVAMLTWILIFAPATSLLASVMVGFRRRIEAWVLLNFNAMARSESPN
jgi:hypothetical protein